MHRRQHHTHPTTKTRRSLWIRNIVDARANRTPRYLGRHRTGISDRILHMITSWGKIASVRRSRYDETTISDDRQTQPATEAEMQAGLHDAAAASRQYRALSRCNRPISTTSISFPSDEYRYDHAIDSNPIQSRGMHVWTFCNYHLSQPNEVRLS